MTFRSNWDNIFGGGTAVAEPPKPPPNNEPTGFRVVQIVQDSLVAVPKEEISAAVVPPPKKKPLAGLIWEPEKSLEGYQPASEASSEIVSGPKMLALIEESAGTQSKIYNYLGINQSEFRLLINRLDKRGFPVKAAIKAAIKAKKDEKYRVVHSVIKKHHGDMVKCAKELNIPLSTFLGRVYALRKKGHSFNIGKGRIEEVFDSPESTTAVPAPLNLSMNKTQEKHLRKLIISVMKTSKGCSTKAGALIGVSSALIESWISHLRSSGHDVPNDDLNVLYEKVKKALLDVNGRVFDSTKEMNGFSYRALIQSMKRLEAEGFPVNTLKDGLLKADRQKKELQKANDMFLELKRTFDKSNGCVRLASRQSRRSISVIYHRMKKVEEFGFPIKMYLENIRKRNL